MRLVIHLQADTTDTQRFGFIGRDAIALASTTTTTSLSDPCIIRIDFDNVVVSA